MKCCRLKCQPTCKKSLAVFDSLPKKDEKSIKPYGMEVCELRLRGGKDDRSPVSRLRPLRSRCTFFSRPGVNTPLEQITVWFNALEEEKSFPLSFQLCNAPALLLKCSFVESSDARKHKTRLWDPFYDLCFCGREINLWPSTIWRSVAIVVEILSKKTFLGRTKNNEPLQVMTQEKRFNICCSRCLRLNWKPEWNSFGD